jgi:hypothetical protein
MSNTGAKDQNSCCYYDKQGIILGRGIQCLSLNTFQSKLLL